MSTGWGRLTWGKSQWNGSTVLATGWGAHSWGYGVWGDLSNENITLAGKSATATV